MIRVTFGSEFANRGHGLPDNGLDLAFLSLIENPNYDPDYRILVFVDCFSRDNISVGYNFRHKINTPFTADIYPGSYIMDLAMPTEPRYVSLL